MDSLFQGEQQVMALKHRLELAYASSAFYRKNFDAAGFHPRALSSVEDLAAIPPITKTDLIEDQAAHPPFGTLFAVKREELRRIFCSAMSMYVPLTADDWEAVMRANVGQLSALGVRSDDVVDVTSGYHWVFAGTVLDESLRRIGAAVIPGGPGNSEFRLQMLRDLGVSVVQAFTTYAEALAAQFAEAGIDPHRDLKVRLLIVGGELRTADATRRLEQAWGGARVREMYGTSEAGVVASGCWDSNDGMHLSDDCVMEIVDPDTGAPTDPVRGGEIVLTSLSRRAQPVIRLRTGDIAQGVDFSPCSCGRSTPRLQRIIGRRSDILRAKGVFVPPKAIAAALEELGGFGRHRIVVDRPAEQDRIRVLAENPDVSQQLRVRTEEKLREVAGVRCEVELSPPGSIPPDAPILDDLRVVS